MIHTEEFEAIEARAVVAEEKYGAFASTHEALGVALEEWNELCAAVQSNKLGSVEWEALDLAAVLVRLAKACRTGAAFQKRSAK